MTFPEWTKPGIYGALVGAVAVSILGFSWGGWTTAGGAKEMADDFADECGEHDEGIRPSVAPERCDDTGSEADDQLEKNGQRPVGRLERRNSLGRAARVPRVRSWIAA